MPERVVRLGIDYGTSFSKIVFRDYGAPAGEKAYVMFRNRSFRVPSAVGVQNGEFLFGIDPARSRDDSEVVWHESIKMRIAGELKQNIRRYCYGDVLPLPAGFSAKDVAVLSLWFLLSEGKRAIREYLNEYVGTVAIGFTLGMPMSFFDDVQLRSVFLRIAKAAWELSKTRILDSSISISDARHYLDDCYLAISDDRDDDQTVRDWIRTEAEAALWWPFMSPAVTDGPYAQIDIGAGTTNISVFRIVPNHTPAGWIKESLSFFGAISPPVGMDAIDRAIAEWKCVDDPLRWRGEEDKFLHGRIGDQLVQSEALQIRRAYKQTIDKAFATLLRGHAERRVWESHKIFFLGGGSLVACLTDQLRISPLDAGEKLAIAELDVPTDLRLANGDTVPPVMFPHVAVAYGLSGYSTELPNVETPNETPPMVNVNSPSRRYELIEMDEWRY